MCCEVEFFWEVCFEEGASGLFSLNVVPGGFHALLPDRCSREFQIVKEPQYPKKSIRRIRTHYPPVCPCSYRYKIAVDRSKV